MEEGPENGGAGGRDGEGGSGKKRMRSMEARMADIKKKQQTRKLARALVHDLWSVEAELRRTETPARRPGRNMLQPVLEDVIARIRGMVQQKSVLGKIVIPADDVRSGLLNASALGVVYVCVDDWVVAESSKGMELLCPFEMVRGFRGYNFACFVHPDDQAALQLLRMQVQSIVPGTPAPLKVRLRVLRVGLDENVLVMAYTPLDFVVAHVGQDKDLGDRLHVLMTCPLWPDSVVPLTFTTLDKLAFQIGANAVSGGTRLDGHRLVKGANGPVNDGGGGAEAMQQYLSNIINRSFSFRDMLSFARSGLFSLLRAFVRGHALFAVAPDGVPWVQRSSAIEFMGVSSGYKPFFEARMSGRLNWISFWSKEPKPFLVGVLKSPSGVAGGVGVALAGLGFEREPGVNDKPPIWALHHFHATSQPATADMLALLWTEGSKVCSPDLWEISTTRTGPVSPPLLAEFLRFDTQKVQRPPAGSP